MNENGWTLDEMDQEAFISPYALDECQRRLELLDEPQMRWPLLPHFLRRYLSRTKVIRIGMVQTHTLYNVQRVHKLKYGFVRDVYAELNVVLIPAGSTTQVDLYTPQRMTKAQKWRIGFDLIALALTPFIVLARLDTLGDLLSTFVLYVGVIGGFTLADLSHFRRARATLYQLVTNALQ